MLKAAKMSGVDQEKSHNLLMVEDNPGDVRLIQEALHDAPFLVKTSIARNGQQALDILGLSGEPGESGLPDIILLDLNLPVRSGQEVLKLLKTDTRTKRIPVVIFSSSSLDKDVEQSYDNHANCYICKPANLDEYLEVIRTSFDHWLNRAEIPGEFQGLLP
jgi:chemotaxis family two-component system response regulator Rcp1